MATKKKMVKKRAAKKSPKKKVVKKKPVKRISRTSVSKEVTPKKKAVKKVRSSGRKLRIAVKNLILFAILSLISYLLYVVSSDATYKEFFSFLAVVLVLIALAFLIATLVLWIMKAMKR